MGHWTRRQRLVATFAGSWMVVLAGARDASADWTVGVFLGSCATQTTSLTLVLPAEDTDATFSPVRYRSASFDPPVYYGYRLGAFPWTRLGIEAEFIHMKAIADTTGRPGVTGRIDGIPASGAIPLASVVERFSITHGVNLLLANAVFRHIGASQADRRPRWIATARLGAGASIPHPESVVRSAAHEAYEWGAFSAQAAAGLEVNVAGAFYGTGEYKITRTVQDVAVAGGSVRTPLVTHHVAFGLTVHLGDRTAAP